MKTLNCRHSKTLWPFIQLNSSLIQIRFRVKALAFYSINRTCDNIYIGSGHKYSSTNYAPPAIPRPATEYIGSDVIEDKDITVEEEREFATQKHDLKHNVDSADEDEVDENQ